MKLMSLARTRALCAIFVPAVLAAHVAWAQTPTIRDQSKSGNAGVLIADDTFAPESQEPFERDNQTVEIRTYPASEHAAQSNKPGNPNTESTLPSVLGPANWMPPTESIVRGAGSVMLFAAVSMAPVALLVLTAFVRISVVLLLVRQAIGSLQVPGNQVMTALALMLTVIVMTPVGLRVHRDAVAPFSEGRLDGASAWVAGTEPIKEFMVDQICKTKHQHYLWAFYDHVAPADPAQPEPTSGEHFPLRVVAPAFLVSELTTALTMGFAIYLPFLIIDMVVALVLSAMGLFLMPPATIALPLKLILFVLADGWMLVSDMLLRSFATS